MASGPHLRRHLGPDQRPSRLGSLPVRALGLDRSLGLDLGRFRTVGLCAVPLWSMGVLRRFLGLGSGSCVRWLASVLCACPCGLVGGTGWGFGVSFGVGFGFGGGCGWFPL